MADETVNRTGAGTPGDDPVEPAVIPDLDNPQGEADSAESPLAELEAELAAMKDRHLRDLAEIENVRRRAQRDKDDALKFGAANLARDILTVADNLRRAIEAVPAAAREEEAVAGIVSGVELVERELLNAFERHGIRKIDPQPGERFDHNVHQAMFELENTGHPAGAVANVMQPGYIMHGRLLRPAMVGVAKGDGGGEAARVDTVA